MRTGTCHLVLAAALAALAALIACAAVPAAAGQSSALAVYDVGAQKTRLDLGVSKLDGLLKKHKVTLDKYDKTYYTNVKGHVNRTRDLIKKNDFGRAAAQLRAGYGSLASAWKIIASIEDHKASDLEGAVKFLTGSYTVVRPLTDAAITALVVAGVEPLGTLLDFFWTGLTAYTDAVVSGKDERAAWIKATESFGNKFAGFACGKAAQKGILEKALKSRVARDAIKRANLRSPRSMRLPNALQTQEIRNVLSVFTRPDVREVMGDIFAKALPTAAFDYIKCKYAKKQHCLEEAHVSFTVQAVAGLGNGLSSDFLKRLQKPGTGINVKSKLLAMGAGVKGKDVNAKLKSMGEFEASIPSISFLYTIPWKLFFEPMLMTLK